MPSENKQTRDRVRELVREVLKNTPDAPDDANEHRPQHVLVNSLKDRAEREFDRDESAKSLITEEDLRGLEEGSRVRVSVKVKFTPLAEDIVRDRSLKLIVKESRGSRIKVSSVAIGCDHGGFAYKDKLKTLLGGFNVNIRDFGTNSTDAVDYPDFAHAVASAVASGQADAGIIIDGAGIGSAIAANKVPGIRAAACYSTALAKNAREHNGANVLTLGSGQNSFDEIAAIVESFLSAELTEERHIKRVKKIESIEKQYIK
jgi:ribose 5-phosphate isomerase B